MNRFLSHKYPKCLAPLLKDGQVVREPDGKTRYAAVTKARAIAIARQLCGDENPYRNPWFHHIDVFNPSDDILVCLDPNEQGTDNAELCRLTQNDNRRIADAIEAKRQCPYFGTVKCVNKCTRCKDCPNIGTHKCRTCKLKCQESRWNGLSRVISRDAVFQEDGVDDMDSQFDPPDGTDIEQEYADREILGALLEKYDASDVLTELQRTVLHHSFIEPKPERQIAALLGYKSKTQVVRIREKALDILRESLKNYRA
jgi:hypothetical protein